MFYVKNCDTVQCCFVLLSFFELLTSKLDKTIIKLPLLRKTPPCPKSEERKGPPQAPEKFEEITKGFEGKTFHTKILKDFKGF